ncbi:hypothetical protein DFH05DRAFT_1522436 [Lentinula detonsa]|uniref:Myb/SANT-like domain-containing protein n=1 Tax=Lentinula detonsa TaxID=2804962 RepID=A0A9W8P746_9AGAR|nr:hypothetical protein DFH05DRAFT_1522436 [Lentinula detonsa]
MTVKQLANGAAAHFVQIGPPKQGGPKTANACQTQWKSLKKIYEAIRDVKDHCYVGASGWPWNDDNGFQVTPENADAWRAFSKAHPVFSPFANRGWPLYEKMSEMCPKIPKGRHVFSAGSSQADLQLSQSGNIFQSILSESQNDEDGLSLGQDEWPESPRHREASPLEEETEAASQSLSQSVSQADKEMIQPTPVKPASAKKRAVEGDDTPATKKARVTGPDALYAISQSTLAVSSALCDMLGSHVDPSPERRKQASLLLKDDHSLTRTDKVSLHLLFSKNTAAADSYRNAEDWIRDDVAQRLLQLDDPFL